jgi:AraC-like DNA-binding protein/mannose-6-phosphate isomerase-like protein (cupin superfamily)
MGVLKSYKNAQITQNHGVRCVVNLPSKIPLHHHDYYEIEIVASGELFHECNGKRMTLSKGDAYILSPDDVHAVTALGNTEVYNLCIYTEQCNKAVARLLIEEGYPRFGRLTDDEMTEISALHDALREELQSSKKYREPRILALTMLLASSLLEKTTVEGSLKSSRSYSTIAKAMTFIEEHLSEPITLEDVALVSGYSRTYFCRLFREIVGINFKDYLARERINLACDLLTNEKSSITEIVYAVGFNSVSSFWRAFKRYKGISPCEFRG